MESAMSSPKDFAFIVGIGVTIDLFNINVECQLYVQ